MGRASLTRFLYASTSPTDKTTVRSKDTGPERWISSKRAGIFPGNGRLFASSSGYTVEYLFMPPSRYEFVNGQALRSLRSGETRRQNHLQNSAGNSDIRPVTIGYLNTVTHNLFWQSCREFLQGPRDIQEIVQYILHVCMCVI